MRQTIRIFLSVLIIVIGVFLFFALSDSVSAATCLAGSCSQDGGFCGPSTGYNCDGTCVADSFECGIEKACMTEGCDPFPPPPTPPPQLCPPGACDDGNSCTNDICDPTDGSCSNPSNGSCGGPPPTPPPPQCTQHIGDPACDDGLLCTADVCQDGICGTLGNKPCWCGDGRCEGNEDSGNCPADCSVAQCSDTIDNDSDGLTDWPADPCCASTSGNNEFCVPPNSAPSVNLVTITEPDYCLVGPAASVTWTYSDPESQPQSAYQVQVDDAVSFQSPVVDSGKVTSGATAFWTGSGLPYNTIFRARVRVWDSLDLVSAWTTMSQCNGPNCQGGASWRTPQHRYPSSISFTNTPTAPQVNEVVQFAGAASCYNNLDNPVACSVWQWTFGDGGTGLGQNPTHTYGTAGSYQATLQVQDAQGYTCPVPPFSRTLTIQIRLPKWKEVLPR